MARALWGSPPARDAPHLHGPLGLGRRPDEIGLLFTLRAFEAMIASHLEACAPLCAPPATWGPGLPMARNPGADPSQGQAVAPRLVLDAPGRGCPRSALHPRPRRASDRLQWARLHRQLAAACLPDLPKRPLAHGRPLRRVSLAPLGADPQPCSPIGLAWRPAPTAARCTPPWAPSRPADRLRRWRAASDCNEDHNRSGKRGALKTLPRRLLAPPWLGMPWPGACPPYLRGLPSAAAPSGGFDLAPLPLNFSTRN